MARLLKPISFGEQKVLVSRFGLDFTHLTQELPESVMTCAIEWGINFFDFGTLGNKQFGKSALQGLPRDQMLISSEFGARLENQTIIYDSSPEYIAKYCEQTLQDLGLEYIDLFYQVKFDEKTPIEETMKTLVRLKNEGKIRYIGLYAVSSEVIRRAHSIHPISAVKVEYSLWYGEPETNEILKTCAELGITIISYSPLSRDFFNGNIKSPEDFAETDWRKTNPRFQGENFKITLDLVSEINKIAEFRKITPSQVGLAWNLSKGEHILPVFEIKDLLDIQENIASLTVKLTPEDISHLEGLFEQQRFE